MKPHVTGLPRRTRASVFAGLVLVFVVVTPLLWLYASGYRLVHTLGGDATSTSSAFMPTGGLYIGVDGDATVSLDGVSMRGSRFFRNAVYLDGVVAGTHRVVVERDGYHAWVKELAVTPQLVVESYAFAVPSTTTVRIVTPQATVEGVPARNASSTIAAAITNTYVVVPRGSRAARTLVPNKEYVSLQTLFTDETTAATPHGSLATMRETIRSLTTVVTATSSPVLATKNAIDLVREGDDIVARYAGSIAKMPSYFCVVSDVHATSTDLGVLAGTTSANRTLVGCDPVVTLDRQGRRVLDVTWYPGAADVVVMVRDDGVFVTEVDPRGGWQNTQPLVRGSGLHARVVDGTIYIYDGTDVYEVVKQ